MTRMQIKQYIIDYGRKKLGYGPGWETRVLIMSDEQAYAIYKDFLTRKPKHGPVKRSSTYEECVDPQITIWDLLGEIQERKENEQSINSVDQESNGTDNK